MPDIMNKTDYEEYEQSVAEFIAREKLSALSTGDEHGDSTDPWFSWSPCECCGSALGGNREHLHAMSGKPNVSGKLRLVQFAICEDCVYYLNYGRLDDQTMLRVKGERPCWR